MRQNTAGQREEPLTGFTQGMATPAAGISATGAAAGQADAVAPAERTDTALADTAREKYGLLLDRLRELESVAVAFSGGVDSTLLLWAAKEALGERVLAVTADSPTFPARERKEAEAFCEEHGIARVVFPSGELDVPGFRENPVNRCYLCKRHLFASIRDIAAERGMRAVAEGSNVDDLGDYRPGLRAIQELEIHSPLREAGLRKAEIRALSEAFGLPTWNKPSFACLSSRFPYGETISEEKLGMVERAEQLLLDLGFRQVRVRMHGGMARLELLPEELPKLFQGDTRSQVCLGLKDLGFSYVTADLEGYRSGSMNEVLS